MSADLPSVLSRLFNRGLFGEFEDLGALAPMLNNYGVDIREDADHICIDADLPGFRKEDVDISLENGTLTIVAEQHEEVEEPAGPAAQGQQRQQQQGQQGQQGPEQQAKQQQQGQQRPQAGRQGEKGSQQSNQPQTYLLRERRAQRYVRSFTLPPNVDEQHVEARMDNGVLRIVLNKREESKPKRVAIQ
jgi:HSP20 family protein